MGGSAQGKALQKGSTIQGYSLLQAYDGLFGRELLQRSQVLFQHSNIYLVKALGIELHRVAE